MAIYVITNMIGELKVTCIQFCVEDGGLLEIIFFCDQSYFYRFISF